MAVAAVENLTVRYGSKTAVSDLSVEIPEGCVGLLGPNGAGKTTLIKTLLGFVQPAAGSGSILGLNVATQGLAIRQRIGLMPEIDCHIPGMNAVTFVAYAGELSGMAGKDAIRRAHEVLQYCGLGEARYRNVETYSTGMKQRIKLAQALVHGPKLVFLDEPTNGLDPQGRDDMLNLVRDISHGKGVNVIVSSHLLPDIERTCDSVIVMRGGKVVTQGDIAGLRGTGGMQFDVELREPSESFLQALAGRGLTLLQQTGSRYRVAFTDGMLNGSKQQNGNIAAAIGTTNGTAAPLPAVPSLPGSPSENPAANAGWLLFAMAKATGAQIRGFRPTQRSLEDIFLEAVE